MPEAEFMKASVVIGAALEPLKRGLATARSMVKSAIGQISSLATGIFSVVGKVMRNVLSAIESLLRKIYSIGKKAFLGLAAVMGIASYASMKQEKAEFMLAGALKAAGDYSAQAMQKFKDFAAGIQKVTTYGDEDILMLMQLMKSLGVTSDKLEEATKQAIGLAAATGRDVQSMAMYIALAQQGEFTMLRRYIPALRATTDATEQLKIVQEFAARGFKLAQTETTHAIGALKQMKNAVGDLMEKFGKPFLDNIVRSAHAIRDWSVAHEDSIARVSAAFDRILETVNFIIIHYVNRMLGAMGKLTDKFRNFETEAKLTDVIWAVMEWAEKIYNRVKAAWDLIVDLWKSDEILNSLKYMFDRMTAEFEKWGRKLVILMPAIADLAGFEFSRVLGERIGVALVDMAEAVGKVSTLVLLPLQKALYMAGRAVIVPGLYGRKPTLEPALAAARRVEAREVPLPPGISGPVKDFWNAIKEWDAATKRQIDVLREEEENAKRIRNNITKQEGLIKKGVGVGTEAAGAPARVGFVGLSEAWKRFAAGLAVKDPTKEAVSELKKLNVTETASLTEMKKISREIATVGTVGE